MDSLRQSALNRPSADLRTPQAFPEAAGGGLKLPVPVVQTMAASRVGVGEACREEHLV